eukprot:257251_1
MGCCLSVNGPKGSQAVPQQSHSQIQVPAPRSPRNTETISHTFDTQMEHESHTQNNDKAYHETKQEPNNIRLHVTDSWDLDADPNEQRRLEFKDRMSERKMEIKQNALKLTELCNASFEEQVSRQRSKSFLGLYEVFQHYATNGDKTKMDIDGLTEALKTFGMVIDHDKNFKKMVFRKFDIDNEREIDYNDFMATMSSLIGTKNEDSLLLMFQIFDVDEDGYLTTEDIARILLAQNQIAVVVTGQLEDATITYTKRQCLKVARKMITKFDSDQFKDDKISFTEYQNMMLNL